MKKILGLTVAALLVMGLVGGGTWAYFSDPETSAGNTFTTGTLDLVSIVSGDFTGDVGNYTVTTGGNGINGNVVFGDNVGVKPGESGNITWTLTNSGTLAGTLTIVATLYSDENSFIEPERHGLYTGTADSGSATTLGDDALTQAEDFFNGMLLTITAGTNVGESRTITDFVDATDTITVAPAFSAAIDNTSTYSISSSSALGVNNVELGGDNDDGSDLDGELDEYLGVTLTRDGTVIYGGTAWNDYKPLSGLEAILDGESRSMVAGASIVYVLEWSISSDVKEAGDDGVFDTGDGNEDDVDDNILQSDDALLDITFTLAQIP